MTGAEIKAKILAAGLKVWQVAEKFGMNDGNFSRKLRKGFSDEESKKVLAIIDELAAEQPGE